MNKLFFLSIFAILLCSSCGPKIVYEQTQSINESWDYNQKIDFNFSIENSEIEYDLLLTVKHDSDFSYQNFYTKIITTYPSSEEFTSPLSIELANKMGSWLSSCNNEECTLHLLLRDNIKFKDVGDYKITFIQDTRDEKLQGINSLGLSLIETKK